MIRDKELAGLAMTLGRDAKITITVSGNDSFCNTDGSHINIARMPSTPLGRMLMTGLVFHEVGHKNFTIGGRPDGLLGDMMNVIEDTRVDMATIKSRPGTCFNLEAVTTHYVNKGSLRPDNLAQALVGKVMAYGFGRVLKHSAILPMETLCDEMMDDAFGQDFIDEVENIIKGIPKLKSTKDTLVMAQKLVELLILQQQVKPPASAPQGQNKKKGNKGSKGVPEFGSPSGDSGQPGQGDEADEQGNNQATGSGGNGAGSGGSKRPTPEEIEEMLNTKTGYGDLSALIQSELKTMADSYTSGDKLNIPMLPIIGSMGASNVKLDEVGALSASSRMRAKLLGMLQAVKRKPLSYGLSGKKLVSSRLSRIAIGDPRIFSKKIDKVGVNTAVMVLLDLSGSMHDKYVVSNAAAFALHTTLFGIHGVAVCSMEFSGKKHQPDVNVLVEFDRKPQSGNFNHFPYDGTPTHSAIWAARVMLLQRPEPRKIMLILTDGCPDKGADTSAATKRAMKDGIEMAAIGIMDNRVQHYWTNHKIINAIEELPAAMFGIMEGLLVTNSTNNLKRNTI